jgi:hypothetical protein
MALLEDEDRDSLEAQMSCLVGQVVDVLLHGVADEDQRVDAPAPVSFSVCESTLPIWVCPPRQSIRVISDLSAPVSDTNFEKHGIRQIPGNRRVGRQVAALADGIEHLGLQRAGQIPGRLAAHGCIERQHDAALPSCPEARGRRPHGPGG